MVTWDQSALLALLKDLYGSAEGSRDFINARCLSNDSGEAVLEGYRSKIVNQFFPVRGEGKLKLGEARKVIRDYRKATGDLSGTAELMMTYVESGVQFTHDFGDINERFYSSVESALEELSTLLRNDARDQYPQFKGRLDKIVKLTDGMGWGFHDYIWEVVNDLRLECEMAG